MKSTSGFLLPRLNDIDASARADIAQNQNFIRHRDLIPANRKVI